MPLHGYYFETENPKINQKLPGAKVLDGLLFTSCFAILHSIFILT